MSTNTPVKLYPFQKKAVKRAADAVTRGSRLLVVSAVGSGKTLIIAELVKDYSALEGWEVILATPRKELVDQALSKLAPRHLVLTRCIRCMHEAMCAAQELLKKDQQLSTGGCAHCYRTFTLVADGARRYTAHDVDALLGRTRGRTWRRMLDLGLTEQRTVPLTAVSTNRATGTPAVDRRKHGVGDTVGIFTVVAHVYDPDARASRYRVVCSNGHTVLKTADALKRGVCPDCTKVSFGGRPLTLTALARIAGISTNTIQHDLRMGRTVEQIVLSPRLPSARRHQSNAQKTQR